MTTTKAGFTPGPWAWSICGDEIYVGVSGLDRVCMIENRPLAGNHAHRAEANARLIAAAPDLYAVCSAIASLDEMGLWPRDCAMAGLSRDAKAALAKASGE